MALDHNGTRFLLYARKRGTDFANTAMIGRQLLHLTPGWLARNLCHFGYPTAETTAKALMTEKNGYAEPFLQLIGAREVCSFDASPFEQATYIHDFNFPIDERFHKRFTTVLDGGTLEHVFNFPVALKNCMELVAIGGHFLGITPANNAFGHGFYQFSPELYYKVFSPENGFRLEQMFAYETDNVDWFAVTDVARQSGRVTLVNHRETYLLVIAQRLEARTIFATPIQQSCYTDGLWEAKSLNASQADSAGVLARLKSRVPGILKPPLRGLRNSVNALRDSPSWKYCFPFDPRYFKKIRTP